jgi:hypothetical protein
MFDCLDPARDRSTKSLAVSAAASNPYAVIIDGIAFDHASNIDAERDTDGRPRLVTPHVQYVNPRNLPLNKYGSGPFVQLLLHKPPPDPGVYAVIEGNGHVLYIGSARNSLAERWGPRGYATIHPRNCFVGGQSTNCRINNLILRAITAGSSLCLYMHLSSDPTGIERQLIAAIRPPWNIR